MHFSCPKKISKNKKNTVFLKVTGCSKKFVSPTGCSKTRLTTKKNKVYKKSNRDFGHPVAPNFFLKKNLSTECQVRERHCRKFPDQIGTIVSWDGHDYANLSLYMYITSYYICTFLFRQLFATNKSTSASFQDYFYCPNWIDWI